MKVLNLHFALPQGHVSCATLLHEPILGKQVATSATNPEKGCGFYTFGKNTRLEAECQRTVIDQQNEIEQGHIEVRMTLNCNLCRVTTLRGIGDMYDLSHRSSML